MNAVLAAAVHLLLIAWCLLILGLVGLIAFLAIHHDDADVTAVRRLDPPPADVLVEHEREQLYDQQLDDEQWRRWEAEMAS